MINRVIEEKKAQESGDSLVKMDGFKFKVVLMGDSLVGKTTLTHRVSYDFYKPDLKRTVGVDLTSKNFIIDDEPIALQIWDFSGEDKFKDMLPMWCRGASGCIFMYDITNLESLFHIYDWLKIVYETLGEDIPLAVIGGKLDLEEERKVSNEIGYEIARFFNVQIFYECSSVSGENVISIFKRMAKRIYYKNKIEEHRREKEEKDKVREEVMIHRYTYIMDIYASLKDIFEKVEWKMMEKEKIIQALELKGHNRDIIEDALKEGIKEGCIYEPKEDFIQFVR